MNIIKFNKLRSIIPIYNQISIIRLFKKTY